jgi:flagellar basal body-associated protein FliL
MSAGKFTVYKLLCAVLVVLLAVIMAGTVTAFVSKKTASQVPNVPNGSGAAAPQPPLPPPTTAGNSSISIKTFSGIGRLRAPLKPESPAKQGRQTGESVPATVVIEPYFSYNSADRAFSEELAAHIRDFRTATLDYYTALPASSPVLNNDEAMKTELLKRYNSFLHLGKITDLYFTNFMIID